MTMLDSFLQAESDALTFGQILYAYRTDEGMSQSDLGKALGLYRQKICDYEHDRRQSGLDTALCLAERLDMDEAVAITVLLENQLRKANLPYKVSLAAS